MCISHSVYKPTCIKAHPYISPWLIHRLYMEEYVGCDLFMLRDAHLEMCMLLQTEKETGFFKEELSTLSAEQVEVRSKIEQQQKELAEMRRVVADYTEALAKNTEHVEGKKKTLMDEQERLLAQNRQLTGDCCSLEDSFIDLQRHHKKTRLTLENYRTNERTLRETEKKLREEFRGLDERSYLVETNDKIL